MDRKTTNSQNRHPAHEDEGEFEMTVDAVKQIEQLLEKPEEAHFYDLLGGLADNLLTIGQHAGTFVECSDCGKTFSLKEESWKCQGCGSNFGLKFNGPIGKTGDCHEVKVSDFTKCRTVPYHWYYNNENWSVAEFLTQILRLQPEIFLKSWFSDLGVSVGHDSALETVWCWPRLAFDIKTTPPLKTIQPDFFVAFDHEIVVVEFKRPKGGYTPPDEILKQMCFLMVASRKLKREWRLVLVPGPDKKGMRSRNRIKDALEKGDRSKLEDIIPAEILDKVYSPDAIDELSDHFVEIGWETLLNQSRKTIRESLAPSWATEQALKKLEFFQDWRAVYGLLAPRSDGAPETDTAPA